MEIRETTEKEWNMQLSRCTIPSVYQDSRWLELIHRTYPGLKIHRIICCEEGETVRYLLPLVEVRPLGRLRPMLISLPFGNYGGFLFPPGGEDGPDEPGLGALRDYFKGSRAFALEIRERGRPSCRLSTDDRFRTFILSFPESIDELWNRVISGNARTSVRKAEKSGVTVHFDHPRAMAFFLELYERQSSFQGTPVHCRSWFPDMKELFPEELEIALARYRNDYVGALLMLHFGGSTMLHAAVTDPLYRHIPVTDRLIWAAFERLYETGRSKSFDFGRTRPVPGKLFFKRKWGGRELPIVYSYLIKPGYRVPEILPENPRLGPAVRLWKKLPRRVARIIGPPLRMRIPT
ncbi:MAG: GNAT family N-acetyltransferase [Deltaproteobacteria bacterium]|nr:GNAT family N-acetyltransferase [Deltaproteobacteria bacterium]